MGCPTVDINFHKFIDQQNQSKDAKCIRRKKLIANLYRKQGMAYISRQDNQPDKEMM
jgi:hypothetical protein